MFKVLSRGVDTETFIGDGTNGHAPGTVFEEKWCYVNVDVSGVTWMFGDDYAKFIDNLHYEINYNIDPIEPNFYFLARFMTRHFAKGIFTWSIQRSTGVIKLYDSAEYDDIKESVARIDRVIEGLVCGDADWIAFTRSFIKEADGDERSISIPVHWLKRLVQQHETCELRLRQAVLKGYGRGRSIVEGV